MYSKARLVLALAVLNVGLVAVATRAADKKAEGKGNTFTSKGVKYSAAASIDFAGVFGLEFEGLATLGSRIDQARRSPDPIALMLVATELAAVEKVSGKSTSLTSEALRREAIEMVKRRGGSQELKVVALLIKDEPAAEELRKLSAEAAQREELQKKGERARGIGTLTVRNFTGHTINIFVNDKMVGLVFPYGEFSFQVNQPPFLTTKLYGRTLAGDRWWGPNFIAEDHKQYYWHLQ